MKINIKINKVFNKFYAEIFPSQIKHKFNSLFDSAQSFAKQKIESFALDPKVKKEILKKIKLHTVNLTMFDNWDANWQP